MMSGEAPITGLVSQQFELLERVGDSVFFAVYKARDRSNRRVVAIKLVKSEWSRDPDFVKSLNRIPVVYSNLNHPNICPILEPGAAGDYHYLIAEFVRGINLKERILRIAPFSLSAAVDFTSAIGEALQAAHNVGIVHGDLRPQNIIISPEGAVKVTDFGMSAALNSNPAAVAKIAEVSSPYRAPEIATGSPPSVATDIYALGIILFEMLTGGVPYSGDSTSAIAFKHTNSPVPSPASRNPGVPRAVDGIVMRALQKSPSQRYASVGDMLNDLKTVHDALRFGRSLSWNPMDGGAARPVSVREAPAKRAPAVESSNAPRTADVIPIATKSQKPGALADGRQVVREEPVSPYLKIAYGVVLAIILAGSLLLVAFYLAIISSPPEVAVPNFIGMQIADAQKAAKQANLILLTHYEYNSQYPEGVVFRTDWAGRRIRPDRPINIWVSNGPEFAKVPNIVGFTEQQGLVSLQNAGLSAGSVEHQWSDSVPQGVIISQTPTKGERVKRASTVVNYVVSDGPSPSQNNLATTEPSQPTNGTPNGSNNGSPPNANQGATPGGVTPSLSPSTPQPPATGNNTTGSLPVHTLNVTVNVLKGPGDSTSHEVKITYEDASGIHTVMDEVHPVGDKIPLQIHYIGDTVTIRVTYDGSNQVLPSNLIVYHYNPKEGY